MVTDVELFIDRVVTSLPVISYTLSDTNPDCGIENEMVVVGLNGFGYGDERE